MDASNAAYLSYMLLVIILLISGLFFTLKLYFSIKKDYLASKAIADKYSPLKSEFEDMSEKLEATTIENNEIIERYRGILDIDAAIKEKVTELEVVIERKNHTINEVTGEIESLRSQYKEKREVFNTLVKEAAIYDETIQLAEIAFYKPHFDYDTSEKFKDEIKRVKEQQKSLIKQDRACTWNSNWIVGGSAAKGKAMQKRLVKMALRAFNGECDTSIANARWNNMNSLLERLNKSRDALNKFNATTSVYITDTYLQLKIKELKLHNEYKIKIQEEKEEQAALRQQIREEASLQKEIDLADKEELKYQKLLEKAQREAEKSAGDKLDAVNGKIAELTKELENAHSKNERAKSMAQQTKRGHVYVISNVGSFGENVYKIGMTRRLEPLDRVKELGDASVPFLFDIHAMIYSDDAPALESALHKEFSEHRLNLVNFRKEFFNVDLKRIEARVHDLDVKAEFILTAEAQHYRESVSIRSQRKDVTEKTSILDSMPEAI